MRRDDAVTRTDAVPRRGRVPMSTTARSEYDVFLLRRVADTPIANARIGRFVLEEVRPLFDVEKLVPPIDWQPALTGAR